MIICGEQPSSAGVGPCVAWRGRWSHPEQLHILPRKQGTHPYPSPSSMPTAVHRRSGEPGFGVLLQSSDPQLRRKDPACSGCLPEHFVFRDLALITFYLFFLSFIFIFIFFPSYASVKYQFPHEVLPQTE